ERTRRQDHLTSRLGPLERAAACILDADGPRALHQNAGSLRAGHDRQVLAVPHRRQIADGCRTAPAVADRILAPAEAEGLGAVVVVGQRPAGQLGRAAPGLEQGIARPRPLHTDRAAAAARLALAVLPALDQLEPGADVGPAPAGGTARGPAVVVA